MSSTQEAETGGGYINAKEAIPICQAAIEMGHPQGPTPLQFDNKCAMGILTGVLEQWQSKGMDMRYYWLRDHHGQGQFYCHWKRGIYNLGDYQESKAHPTKHHIAQRPLYVGNNLIRIMAKSFLTLQRQNYVSSARVC
jgi:hypothetical protein